MKEFDELKNAIDRWAQRQSYGSGISVEDFTQQLINDGWSKTKRVDVKVSLRPDEETKLQERIERILNNQSKNRMTESEIVKKVCNEMLRELMSNKRRAVECKFESIKNQNFLDGIFYLTKINVISEVMDLITLFAKSKGVSRNELENE